MNHPEVERDYVRPHHRDQPTIAPPDRSSIATDLRARADRLDQLALQTAREAMELRDVADRLERQ